MTHSPPAPKLSPLLRPDPLGWFGDFGGRFAPETLMPALEQLEQEFQAAQADPSFTTELDHILANLVGRPTPLYHAERLSERMGAEVWLKREDLAHTGAHKINNAIGQGLLAKRMGKSRLIAETGAGQHGVAVATAAAYFGLPCTVYMGEVDMLRQSLNVVRMRILGTEVTPVTSGARTLKDAVSETMRDWARTVEDTHYVIGSVVGPHPFPWLVREFQRVIGEECRLQWGDRPPDLAVACVGGGSNAMGLFYPLAGLGIELVGVEAGGEGLNGGRHGASLVAGEPGVLHGAMSYMLADPDGRVREAHSISAGLDYPGVGPEHSYFQQTGIARYVSVTDQEALAGVKLLAQTEGIIPALESAHAISWIDQEKASLSGKKVLVNLSGRGDKDTETIAQHLPHPV